MGNKYIQIQTTFNKREEAVKFAELILDVQIVACGQISEIESFYNFEGKRCHDKEYRLSIKTRTALYNECEAFIKAHHPYKVPQIIAVQIIAGSLDYLDWIDENTKRQED